MFKMIFLVLGLAVGFGGGVYWAHHNPDAAAKLSAEEEKRFLEAQLAISEKIQSKLDQLSNQSGGSKMGSGFVSSQSGGASAADVNDLKSQTQQQQDELKKRIAQLR
ncbi:MAG TPA: hypothetical protein VL282_09940 [Tepidisphaeraceae bacterium]|jgi:hypothetical protein|nr:hypothetical protein [Tepidisphaeraceae bacterium]